MSADAGGTAASTSARTGRPRLRHVQPFLVGLLCFGLLAIVDQARHFTLWRNYALSGLGMGAVVCYVVWRKDVRLPHFIQWVIVGGLLLHYGGGSLGSPDPYHMGLFDFHGVNGAYHEYDWWDHLTHAVGMGAAAMAIAYLAEAFQLRRGLAWPSWAVAALAIGGSLTAGVGVELYEYLGKSAFQTIDQGGYVNTMRDLHYNVLGAVVGAVVTVAIDRKRLAARIARHWGVEGRQDLAGDGWTRRVTPGTAGFVAFTLPPTLATLALGGRFLLTGPVALAADDAAYETALHILLASAILGVVAGLATTALRRRAVAAQEPV